MRLDSLELTNFRCFGPEPHRIEFVQGVTALIGANASGKSAVLHALCRMFGSSEDERRIRRADFHVPPDEEEESTQRTLCLEALFAFPELDDEGSADESGESGDAWAQHDDSADPVEEAEVHDEGDEGQGGVAEYFHHLIADEEENLVLRVRLDATWTADGTADGLIDSQLRVVNADGSEGPPLRGLDRSKIRVEYVPSSRDGAVSLRSFLRGRVWQGGRWSDELEEEITSLSKKISEVLDAEEPVQVVLESLTSSWQSLGGAGFDSEPSLHASETQIGRLLAAADLRFEPTEHGVPRVANELSDGQRSLLHLALVETVLTVEGQIRVGATDAFVGDRVRPPALTIVALEEPENSLAPYYLSRIMELLHRLPNQSAQSIVTSHSPSTLGRVDPRNIRCLRHDPPTGRSEARPLKLPDLDDEAHKYVLHAVRAFPELYFARFVILGEGPSEQIVIPALAGARGLYLDRSFVSMVPLGGRHVNHMWRLLHDLGIPHATLLDLDLERSHGGVKVLRSVAKQLSAYNVEVPAGAEALVGEGWGGEPEEDTLWQWIDVLEQVDVFFSVPLDIDWAMLTQLPEAYKSAEGSPSAAPAHKAVLGSDDLPTRYENDADLLRWYRYLFLTGPKPVSHLRALAGLADETLKAGTPDVIARLLDRVAEALE